MSEWTDIGKQLSKARESKGLELMDVAHTTRIPLATLSALEENDYSIFPSPAYARSFLAQYSEHLGVDADEWVDAFETGDVLSNVNEHSYLQPGHDHVGNQHSTATTRRKNHGGSKGEQAALKDSGKSHLLQTLTVFVVTGLLIGGGIYAYKKYETMLKGSRGEQTDGNSGKSSLEPAVMATSPVADTSVTTQTPEKANLTTGANDTDTGISANPANQGSSLQSTALVKPIRSGPPPKAMVIDEGEE